MDAPMVMGGFNDPQMWRLGFFEMTVAAKNAAERQAACRVVRLTEFDNEDNGRGLGADSECPYGVQNWSPT